MPQIGVPKVPLHVMEEAWRGWNHRNRDLPPNSKKIWGDQHVGCHKRLSFDDLNPIYDDIGYIGDGLQTNKLFICCLWSKHDWRVQWFAMAIAVLAAYGTYVTCFVLGVCWSWPQFVETNEPDKVRRSLFGLWVLLTLEEWLLYILGVVSLWSLIILLFCNVWGHLDAFLRFPIVHDLDSFFALKQLFLLLFKIGGYLLGFKMLRQNLAWAVLVLLLNVCTLPIIWLTALPIGDVTSYHQKHDVKDQDLALRLWRVVLAPTDRSAAMTSLKSSGRKMLAALANAMPWLKPWVLRIDPVMVRVLRKTAVWQRERDPTKATSKTSGNWSVPVCRAANAQHRPTTREALEASKGNQGGCPSVGSHSNWLDCCKELHNRLVSLSCLLMHAEPWLY